MKLDLRKTIKENGFTQRQFGRMIGFHEGTVLNWCAGVRNISKQSQDKIIDWLKDHNFDIFYIKN